MTNQTRDFLQLTPISCGKCGSSVPLGSDETVACIYCGAMVAIPENYRRGLEARQSLEAIRDNARNFLARLGTRPAKWEIWLSLMPSWLFLLMLLVSGTFIYSMMMTTFKYWLSMQIGVAYADYFPEMITVAVDVGLFFILLSLAMAAFFIVRRRVFVSRRLMTVLAAGMPIKPGGPATCRHCGAPFLVADDELVVACNYCGTENFLRIPTEWLSETRQLSSFSGRNAFWAEREFEREMTSSHLSLMNQLKLYGFFFLLFTVAFLQGDSEKIDTWHRYSAKSERQVLGIAPDAPVPVVGRAFKVHGVFRKFRNERQFKYKIALKQHETLKFTLFENGPVEIRLREPFKISNHRLNAGESIEFNIEIGGWSDLYLTAYSENPLPDILIEIR